MNAPFGTAPELDDLTITIVVDDATDTLSSIDPGMPQTPEIAYLLGGIAPIGEHDAHGCVVAFDHASRLTRAWSGGDSDLAVGFAGDELTHRVGCLIEWVGAADTWCHCAGLDELGQFVEVGVVLLGDEDGEALGDEW